MANASEKNFLLRFNSLERKKMYVQFLECSKYTRFIFTIKINLKNGIKMTFFQSDSINSEYINFI